MLNPIAFGELLGIDHDTTRETLIELAANQQAFQWHTMGHTYRVLQHDHDEGYASYEVFP